MALSTVPLLGPQLAEFKLNLDDLLHREELS